MSNVKFGKKYTFSLNNYIVLIRLIHINQLNYRTQFFFLKTNMIGRIN